MLDFDDDVPMHERSMILPRSSVEQLVDVGMKQSGKQVQLNTVGQAVLVEELSDMAKSYTIGGPISFTVMIDVYP